MSDQTLLILLVEDNEDDYVIVRDLLRDIDPERFALEWAASYADGLRAIQAQRHDLVLSDFRLSDGTGLELLQETQAVSGRAPVILMTGQGDRDIDRQAMQAGAADYLVKDLLDADRLERAIRYAVERRKSAEALRASEDRYRTFVENSTEGIWRFELERPMPTDLPEDEQIAHLDRYAYVAECNEAMARIYGYDHASDVIGARFGEFLWSREVSDDNYPRRLIRNRYRLVSVEAFEYDRHGQAKCVLHNLIGVVENGLLYRIWGSQSDITAQKRSENAQAQLAAIVDTSDDAIFSKTVEGLIVTWNKGAEALYGYTAQEVTGQHVSLLSGSPAPPRVRQIQERVAGGERVPQFESVHRHKSGTPIDVSLSVSPIVDAAGHVTGSATIARDITERKRTEASLAQTHTALAESEARFRASVDAMEEGLILHDADGSIVFCNGSAERILGLTADQMTGRTSLDPCWRAIREDGTAFPGEQHPSAVALREGVTQCDVVMGIHRPDGELRWVNVNAVPLQSRSREASPGPGRAGGVVVTFDDTTGRRHAQMRLRQSEANMADAQRVAHFGSWDMDMSRGDDIAANPRRWSDETFRIFGYEPGSVPVDSGLFYRVVPPEEHPIIRQAMASAVAERRPVSFVHRVRRPDGEERIVRQTAQYFEGETVGQPPRMVGTVHDITELRQAEEYTHFTASLLSQVRNAVIATDLEGRITYWNAFAETLYQWKAEEVLGKNIVDVTTPVQNQEVGAGILRQIQDTGSWEGEFPVRRKDGSAFPAHVANTLFRDANGVVTGMVGVSIDITERKTAEKALEASEDRLSLILRNVEDVVFLLLVDPAETYRFLFVNPSFIERTGLREEQIIGRRIQEVLPEPAYGIVLEKYAEAIRERRTIGWQETSQYPAGERVGEVRVTPFFDEQGCCSHLIGTVHDITERKQAEEALRASERFAQSALDGLSAEIAILDGEGAVLAVNQAWRRFAAENTPADQATLLTEKVFEGANYLSACGAATGEEAEEGRLVAAGIRAVAAGEQELFTLEYPCHSPWEQRWFSLRATPFPGEGPARVVVSHENVTDRKQAEVWLSESRHRLALAKESAKIGIWDWDVTADSMFWDPQMYALYGVREQDFSGAYDAWRKGLHPEDRDRAEAEIAPALDGTRDFHTQFRVVWPGGEVRHIEAHATVLRADDGTARRMIGVNWDITESKRAEAERDRVEQALRENEHRLRLMLESGRFGTFRLDLISGRYLEISDIGRGQFALPPGDVFSTDFFQRVHPDDRDGLQAAAARAAAAQETDFASDYRIVLPNASVRWISVHGALTFDEAGRPVGMLGVTQDITERKQAEAERDRVEDSLRRSEKRFRSVVERVESLVIHDAQGRLIDVNQNACDSLGYTREELLRLRVPDYELKYEQANVARLWEQMLSGEINTVIVDGLHRRKDGSAFPVEVRVGLLETDGPPLMVAVARDITERRQAQDALQEAEQEQRQLAARLEAERARLAEAQAVAKVGSWELDSHTGALIWSDENYRIFGLGRGGFDGTYEAFLGRVHPDDRAAVDQAYRDSVAYRTPYEFDHRIWMDDGSVKFVHERCQTFYDDDGRPIRSLGTTQDITESHLVMEALRQSEHRFRRIVETTHEGVLQLDENSEIIYVNQRYCEMLGYTVEELLGRSPFDLMDEESRVLAQRSLENSRAGATDQFDRRFRHKDGSVVWGIVSASPILDEAGRMVGSFSMTTDITERKRLESQVHQSEKLAALGELVAGVAHEINNPLAAILGNAELLEMHADPQVREDAQAIKRMSDRVTRIVRSLLTFSRPQEKSYREEAVNDIVRHTLEMTTHKLRTAGVTLTLRLPEPSPVASANANEIQQILLNLVLNAEHALRRAEGEKRLVITTGGERIDGRDWATVSVADNGCGIPEEIRARIFDPFFTTKDVGEGTGLGLSICHGIAKAHGGSLSVESAVGLGTTFTLALPTPAARIEAGPLPSLPRDSPRSGEER